MSARQREFVIYIRPYYSKRGDIVVHRGAVASGKGSDDEMLKGYGEGMEEWNTLPVSEGAWIEWYRTTSYPRLREKYRECLGERSDEDIRIAEELPLRIDIIPNA